jgi:hypothetical protein
MVGYWGEPVLVKGYKNGALGPVIGYKFEFTADSSDGTIPDLNTASITGISPLGSFIFGIDYKKDATTPANNLTIIQKTINGNTQWSPAKLTDSGFRKPDAPEPVAGGFILSAAQDDAKTNSAKGQVTILIG